ncbi:hypothetical protein GQ53DRAFT_796879 [Thozetella sp. PMI_491]|nr:hypothetical protein GQ53DRAFT_796879 [Thozetella sp. PMI_491]
MDALHGLHHAVSGRRSSKVCARCRKRKSKCDSGYPSCSACAKAGAVCRGYDSAGQQDLPRSLVRALEDQVAKLEQKASDLHNLPANATFALTSRLAQAILPVKTSSPQPFFLSNLTTLFLLGPSCLPLAVSSLSVAEAGTKHQFPQQRPLSTNLGQIPYAAIEQMIINYTSIHLPQYPCIPERDLCDLLERILQAHGGDTDAALTLGIPTESRLTHCDYFTVFIALAVSSLTLTWKNEHQARIASNAFFETALSHLRLAAEVTEIQRLQALLLLAHYAHLNPTRLDNWVCIWNATRIVLELGLHTQASEMFLRDEAQARFQNQLFWCAYGMERSLSATVRLPLSFPEAAITKAREINWDANTKYSSASHLYRFRALETEVHRVLYLRDSTAMDNKSDLSSWFIEITNRLDNWLEKATEFSRYRMLEFRRVQYGLLKARLFRPTPRIESRSPEDRVKYYRHQIKRRRLFYPWHGVHNLFEAAVIMLESYWALRDYEPLNHQARHVLAVTLPDCLALVNKVGESWADAALCSTYLSPVLEEVFRAFSSRALTTEKLRKLLFPDGPLLWSSRLSFDANQAVATDASLSADAVTLDVETTDWDVCWEFVEDLSPIWSDALPQP